MYIRLAKEKDFDFFYDLKCGEKNLYWSGFAKKPEYNNLLAFFDKELKKNARKIYIIIDGEDSVGCLCLVENENGTFTLSIAIADEYIGKGYGKRAYAIGLEEGEKLGYNRKEGLVLEDNIASQKMQLACGCVPTGKIVYKFIENRNKTMKMLEFVKDL